MHIIYPKIKRIWTDECEWIREWDVYIQEKIDWANLQIWIDENNSIYIGSRTQIVYNENINKWFNGAVEYVLKHEWIKKLLADIPNIIIYWEWLVKHTIVYPVEHYNQFYMFDIFDKETWLFYNINDMYKIAWKYWILTPKLFYNWVITEEDARKFVWKTVLWDTWE